jgi:hypothetical protein
MKYLGMLALAALSLPVAAAAQDSATIANPITSLFKVQAASRALRTIAGCGSRSHARRQVQLQIHAGDANVWATLAW